jgi:hypothetical protein
MSKDSGHSDTLQYRQRSATHTWAPNAELFVQNAGLNPYPDTYANRGATTADLGATTLELIRVQIATHIGPEAASNYVEMIQDIPYLSTEAFLTMLYALELSAWRWDRSALVSRREFSSKTQASSDPTDTVLLRDETHYIKTQFMKLRRSDEEGIKLEKYSW